ncbi:hypothetical protein KY284_027370 [Solanum tuberosum]|nr:hypothetical protein KY284_027370 [Solanum tuberosum]
MGGETFVTPSTYQKEKEVTKIVERAQSYQSEEKNREKEKERKKNTAQTSREDHSRQKEEGKNEMDTEGTLVIYEANIDEVLPLAMLKDSQEDAHEPNKVKRDKDDFKQIIAKVTIKGDLSPKQTGKLKEFHTKPKKKGGELHADHVSSRSKRMIIKNSKYQ